MKTTIILLAFGILLTCIAEEPQNGEIPYKAYLRGVSPNPPSITESFVERTDLVWTSSSSSFTCKDKFNVYIPDGVDTYYCELGLGETTVGSAQWSDAIEGGTDSDLTYSYTRYTQPGHAPYYETSSTFTMEFHESAE